MPKFKHKKTGKIIEENILYYLELLRKNPKYEEIKDLPVEEKKDKKDKKDKEQPKNEVEEEKPLQ